MKALPWKWMAFGLAVVLQWAAPFLQITTFEKVLAQGKVYQFRCRAPDPYDMLRGRYLAVRAEPDTFVKSEEFDLQKGESLFATIAADEAGMARIVALSRERPASGDYVRVQAGYTADSYTYVVWPFDRFYLNEKAAPKADEWYRQNVRASEGITAEVRVLDGHAVLVDLKQGDRSFRELLEREPSPGK